VTRVRPLVPAALMAMTKGALAAFETSSTSGWLKGTRTEMDSVPRI